MAKSQASIMVRGLDLGASFLSALTKAARERGISDEALYELLKPEGPLVSDFVRLIAIRTDPNLDMAGSFFYLATLADQYVSGEVKGPDKRRVGEDMIGYIGAAVQKFCEQRKTGFQVEINGKDPNKPAFRLVAEVDVDAPFVFAPCREGKHNECPDNINLVAEGCGCVCHKK